jgi:hypothetical protein
MCLVERRLAPESLQYYARWDHDDDASPGINAQLLDRSPKRSGGN